MGTTLQNGVYLPNEGERNCYAGLKTNWEILDQKVADITALQQAVAGALHREIVESLPTTDIDPNTIYMILSGTSATENVYNEFMYVNNAWELIGTSATDLTNYYTKAEVDGKLLLKANASDLTSHTGDTTIHVTTADKTKWNNGVSQSYVLRYSSSSVTDNSTIAYSTLDNTDNIKSGDKVIDVDGKIFSVVSVDTTNQTITVGTALIDLALDGNVVHTSGDETVAGIKNFTDDTYIKSLNFTNEVASPSSSSSAILPIVTTVTYTDQTASKSARINLRITASGDKSLYPHENNQYALGLTSRKWSEVHAMTYYYGSSDVEFSTKFVTTDTNQTISGVKTFSSDLTVANTDTTANTPNLSLRNYKADRGTTDTAVQAISFLDKNAKALTTIESRRISNGNTATNILCYNTDNSNNTVSGGVAIIKSKTDTNFAPNADNAVTCGRALAKWSDVQTYKVNALEPSSLSLPSGNVNDIIDISSYLSILDGSSANTYIAPANGWISITMSNSSGIQAYINGLWGHQIVRPTVGGIRFLMPILKNLTTNILIFGGTVDNARFIPCQGNV